jgi:hypothetical protein
MQGPYLIVRIEGVFSLSSRQVMALSLLEKNESRMTEFCEPFEGFTFCANGRKKIIYVISLVPAHLLSDPLSWAAILLPFFVHGCPCLHIWMAGPALA